MVCVHCSHMQNCFYCSVLICGLDFSVKGDPFEGIKLWVLEKLSMARS